MGSARIAGYNWNFGDGNTATRAAVSHSYANPGTYTATLSVTDSARLTGTAMTTVTVDRAKGKNK